MSYTVLARRYRSGTFDEVVGQAQVAQTLKKAIASGRVAHAFLFCGTRGVGKTSMARILAKALNCMRADGPTTEPCGECDSCLAIARGDDIDVIEIDAASNTGVDNIRDLIENSQYRPARCRLKVYIIDEVHMLSKSAFNALLKTLEEPPAHVKFILATTEPEKVLPTILSRCQRYDFRNIPTREIADHLRGICQQERIEADDGALLLVARAGAGSMRDALSLLDRLLSIGETKLSSGMVEGLLGLPRSQVLFDLADAIGTCDTKAVLSRSDAAINAGLSPEMLVAALVDHLRNLLILNACGGATDLVEAPGLAMDDLSAQAQRFDTVVLTQDITILEELRRMLRTTQAGRALLDATLVRLALAEQFASVSELLERVNAGGGSTAGAQKKKPELTGAAPAPIGSEISPAARQSDAGSSSGAAASDGDDDLPAVGRVWDGPSLGTRTLLKPRVSRQAGAPAAGSNPEPIGNIEAVDPRDLGAVWRALLAVLAGEGPGLNALLTQGQYAGSQEGQAVIRFDPRQETFLKMLDRNGRKERVREALSRILRQPVAVRFELAPDAAPDATEGSAPPVQATPRPPEASSPASAPTEGPSSVPLTAQLLAELNGDPLIAALREALGGTILKVTQA